MFKRNSYTSMKPGFTIVELLIVVVVIAILAAITIVSYNGISNRATAASAQSSAATALKKVATYAIDNNEYFPASLTVLNSLGLVNSGDLRYQYTSSAPFKTYCLTATVKTQSYYVSDTQQSPISGTCPGHNASGVSSISNIALNPSAEAVSPPFTGPNSTAVVIDTAQAHTGTHSILATMPVSAIYTVGTKIFTVNDLMGDLKPNTNYTVSAWVYVQSSAVDVQLSVQGAGRATQGSGPERATSLKSQWVRVSQNFTTSSSGSLAIYLQNAAATTTANTKFWTDDIMVTEGTSPPLYADGNSSGWVWNGTINSATSTGLPL